MQCVFFCLGFFSSLCIAVKHVDMSNPNHNTIYMLLPNVRRCFETMPNLCIIGIFPTDSARRHIVTCLPLINIISIPINGVKTVMNLSRFNHITTLAGVRHRPAGVCPFL